MGLKCQHNTQVDKPLKCQIVHKWLNMSTLYNSA